MRQLLLWLSSILASPCLCGWCQERDRHRYCSSENTLAAAQAPEATPPDVGRPGLRNEQQDGCYNLLQRGPGIDLMRRGLPQQRIDGLLQSQHAGNFVGVLAVI